MVNSRLIQREEEEKEEEKEEGGGGEEREREEERKREREREVLMIRSREMACGISFEATATSTVLFLLVSNVNLNEHVLLLNHFYTPYTDILQHLPLPLTFFYISRFLDVCILRVSRFFFSSFTKKKRNEERP